MPAVPESPPVLLGFRYRCMWWAEQSRAAEGLAPMQVGVPVGDGGCWTVVDVWWARTVDVAILVQAYWAYPFVPRLSVCGLLAVRLGAEQRGDCR